METRSRKRAEAAGTSPSPGRTSKRSRLSNVAPGPDLAPATALPPPPRPRRVPAAARTNQDVSIAMESALQSSSSASRTERSSKKDQEMEDDRGLRRATRGFDKERETVKGKQKETSDAKRNRGKPIAAAAVDEDDDGDGNISLHNDLASPSIELQGLLMKLGAGLDELLPTSVPYQNSKLKRILSGLRAEGEEARQLEALSQLCELLCIGTEDSLSSFSVDSFVPVLVGLLNHEYNPDMMLLAARALTHLCDVLPSSCVAVVHYGAVPSLCARLLTIEYIDLAEQSLQALEKISHEHPTACLRGGALLAVLSYLDFFPIGVQRVAVSTAANICRQLPADAADFVIEAVPTLTNLLKYHDTKVVEHSSVCLTRIAESFALCPEKLDMLCSHDLLSQVVRLVSVSTPTNGMVSQTSLSISTYTGLIRLLSTCAKGSAVAGKSLLLLNISSILKDILAGSGLIASISISPSAVNRPPEQLLEIVTLVNELLPPMPESAVPPNGVTIYRAAHRKPPGGASAKCEDLGGVSPREKLLQECPGLLVQFASDIFPVLIQVYGSSVNPPVRHKCLAVVCKLVHFSTAEMLRSLFIDLNIASFIAGVLASKDSSVLITALQIAEMLMVKLPGIFTKLFVKEGVVHAVENVIAAEQPLLGRMRDGSEASSGTPPSRPRRGTRRRSGGPNSEIVRETSSSWPVGSLPSTSVTDTCNQVSKNGIRAQVIAAAKYFKETYFPAELGTANTGIIESLNKLKALCAKLNGDIAPDKGKSKGKFKVAGHLGVASDDVTASLIGEILGELCRGDGVSTFEFIGSGIVGSLLNYFSCRNHSRDGFSNLQWREHALNRLKQFISLAMPLGNAETDLPATVLVRKLQNALASLEHFPVVLSTAPRSGSGNAGISAGLGALAHPLKLRFLRAPGEKTLRDYSSNIVLIDPLATLSSVEEFLWPRVQKSDMPPKSVVVTTSEAATKPNTTLTPFVRPSTRSRSASEVQMLANKDCSTGLNATSSKGKGKGKVGAHSLADEPPGPETRNGSARRRAIASARLLKQAQDGCGPPAGIEDDDGEFSPLEYDEAIAMEEDEFSEDEEDEEHEEVRLVFGEEPTLCTGDRVHDVQLGDSVATGNGASTSVTSSQILSRTLGFGSTRGTMGASGVEVTQLGKRGSSTSKTSLSFAAAAMAGLASASGKGLRASRDRRALAPTIPSSTIPARLSFSLSGKPLNRSSTIFQAIQRQAMAAEEDDERFAGLAYPSVESKRLWDEVYTICYWRVDNVSENVGEASTTVISPKPSSVPPNQSGVDGVCQQASLLDSILNRELPCDLDKSNLTYDILLLLRVLDGLNRLAPRLHAQAMSDALLEGRMMLTSKTRMPRPLVPQEEFLSSKLTPKLARQMQDALALCSGGLPAWCYQLTRACPFLFPFETRKQYFYSTAFGLSRALQRLQQQQNVDNPLAANDREVRVGRLQRQKVRVSRSRILESAAKVMELYSGQKAVLEVEYFGEVGTGLGPTLEFYTLLSRDLQKVSLKMWRTSSSTRRSRDDASSDISMQDATPEDIEAGRVSEDDDYVCAPHGLFPRPWPPSEVDGGKLAKVIERFRLLGQAMGKALQDGRLLDLPLSSAFYKSMLGQELDLYDIKSLDLELGKTLQELQDVVQQEQFLESSTANKKPGVRDLRFRDTQIEELCLNFTLPGYPEYLLKPGGHNIMVTAENLEEYISLVVDATVRSGIARQLEAFRVGFNQVFQISSLQIFCEEELDYLLCGCREVWLPEMLMEHIKFDHGYTIASPPIRNLLEVMEEFSPEQQCAFLRFVTGAPRLPSGGLAALHPKLTIVRKHPTGMNSAAAMLGSTPPGLSTLGGTTLADGDLPSVMTCANYLKLPPYSCKEVMRERLLYAICEGQGSFDLS